MFISLTSNVYMKLISKISSTLLLLFHIKFELLLAWLLYSVDSVLLTINGIISR